MLSKRRFCTDIEAHCLGVALRRFEPVSIRSHVSRKADLVNLFKLVCQHSWLQLAYNDAELPFLPSGGRDRRMDGQDK